MSGPVRILVTGSRDWTDRDAVLIAIGGALATYSTTGLPVLVHGKCPRGGADSLAEDVWQEWRAAHPDSLGVIERHDWRDYGSFRDRNAAMVHRGATVCLAFATTWASGTGMTARMARRAGIPTWDYGVDTRIEARP